MTDFLEIDFCKGRTLRVARRFDVSDGIVSDQLAGATSLGCNFPVSHRDNGVGEGVILSRVNKQSGKDVSDLLTSPNESLPGNPGPTAWLSAVPDVFLPGDTAPPFPVTLPVVNDSLVAGGATVSRYIPTAGFGDGSGFRQMVVVPPGSLEYVDPGPLALHQALRRFKTVSSPNPLEAYGLVYRDVNTGTQIIQRYVWGSNFASSAIRLSNSLWNHSVFLTWYGTPPALAGNQLPIQTPAIGTTGFSSTTSLNGPDQASRVYSHPIVHGEFTNPDFSETLALTSQLSGTRPTLTIFSQSQFDAAFGYDVLTFGGTTPSFAPTAIPSQQYIGNFGFGFPDQNGFSSGVYNNGTHFFQVYGPIDQAFSMDVPLAATSINVQILPFDSVNPTPVSINMNLPKAANQSAWIEAWLFVRSDYQGGGPPP